VALPAQEIYYGAIAGKGAFRLAGSKRQRIFNTRTGNTTAGLDSRFHSSPATSLFFSKHAISEIRRYGSAIKFCKLAEGEADIYPRLAPTKEWDTAAGHCILMESGCVLLDASRGTQLVYNKPSLVNPWFIALRANLESEKFVTTFE
jgi:3'(2'), 5'-bisphosphate nucleotidase